MKSLGKQTILENHFTNGSPTLSVRETRMVYQKEDGTYWVNHMGKKIKVDFINNEYTRDIHVTSAKAYTFDDIVTRAVQQQNDMKKDQRLIDLVNLFNPDNEK